MKKIFKKNQIIITALALIIAVAGYINYSDNIKNKNKKSTSEETTAILDGETDPANGGILSNDAEPDNLEDPGTAVFTSTLNSQFIISAKLEREQSRASDKESLLEVINNAELSEEVKADAVATMVALAEASEKEAAAELLLEAKGFNNVIVSVTYPQVDVVIETEELTDTDLARIEDVVTRKTGCSVTDLTITTVSPVKEQTEATGGQTTDSGDANNGEGVLDESEADKSEDSVSETDIADDSSDAGAIIDNTNPIE
ncbi:MAG: SpoIIIAH-like family protein [Butyrivibrio sp.]